MGSGYEGVLLFSFSPVGAFENQAMLKPWEMMCKGLGKAWSGGEEEGK